MSFTAVKPQVAKDDAGRIVQVRDRWHVELIDGPLHAVVQVVFGGPPTRIHSDTLRVWKGGEVVEADLDAIVAVLADGLGALVERVEVVPTRT